ncbi:hypothetical protein G7046_g7489 [Stylonectria norvegica]|nr:hypothetical protein G7046_g7489 [Stylonectria norvegica]
MASPFQRNPAGSYEPPSPSAAGVPAQTSRVRFPPSIPPSSSSRFSTAGDFSRIAHPPALSQASHLSTGDAISYGDYSRVYDINMNPPLSDDPTRAWATDMPFYSRAFNNLLPTEPRDPSRNNDGDTFFIPSYLEHSVYVQTLEEAHRSKLQARESNRTSTNKLAPDLTTFNQHQHSQALAPGSHRGMSHTVIERPPAFEEDDDTLPPLPTKWNKDDKYGNIEVQNGGIEVKYVGPKSVNDREYDACAVRADHYMPAQCGVYYYEVRLLVAKRDDTNIAIGFSNCQSPLTRPIGWEPDSWGYHSDDGRCFSGHNTGKHYGPTYSAGDVIGCGINFRDNTAFFTKNGLHLGTAVNAVTDLARDAKLYPTISLKKPGEHIRVNFGQSEFAYNINDMVKDEREKIERDIQAADTSKLVPGMNETELIQSLVLQFLQHDGYVETARAFAEDMKTQKEALNLDPNVKIDGISIEDDEDANNRQRIRRAILEGDIDRALKYTTALYPRVLKDNEHVYFRLRCRKFIEMVRKAAQLNTTNDTKKSNGHTPELGSQEMDLDINGSENPAWTNSAELDDIENPTELAELERSMLLYGQVLQAEYAKDPRREVTQALGEIWSLVAYANPLKEPQVSHLLDKKGRVAVAEELNSAILLSLGKSSSAALETLYAQTNVLLEDLRQDGGDGAFVSVGDIIDTIPAASQI